MPSFPRHGGATAVDPRGEHGSALIGVVLLLMLMSGLAAALAVSGQTETLVVRNRVSTAQARAAAEAGLNHAVQVVVADIRQAYVADGLDGVEAALDRLLAGPDEVIGTPDTDADNGSLELFGIPLGERIDLAGIGGAGYEARVMDEDDPAREGASQLLDDPDADNDEDGGPFTDANESLVIRSVGYGRDNTSVILEAIIAPPPFPAVLTNACRRGRHIGVPADLDRSLRDHDA